MNTRILGKTGLNVGEIGVGTEHMVKASTAEIREIVRTALGEGCNYFDVLMDAPSYVDGFGEAFAGVRDRAVITAHLFTWDPLEKCIAKFEDFLRRMKCGYADILFVSCCDREDVYDAVTDLSGKPAGSIMIGAPGQEQLLSRHGGHLGYAKQMQTEGKARFIGFSTHSVTAAVRAIQDGHFDVLMFPVNPVFDTLPPGAGMKDLGELWELASRHGEYPLHEDRKELCRLCERSGIGIIAMKPFAAGWLFRPELDAGITPVRLLSYALSRPGVNTVIPGAGSLDELKGCLAYVNASREQRDFSGILKTLQWNPADRCMYCSHCQPCPAGIDIAAVNRLYDLLTDGMGADNPVEKEYAALMSQPERCKGCGMCRTRCPFGIDVPDRMRETARRFQSLREACHG